MCRRKLAERNSSSLSRVYARVHEENSAVGDGDDDDGGGGGGVPPKAMRKHPLAIIITRVQRARTEGDIPLYNSAEETITNISFFFNFHQHTTSKVTYQ